MYLKKTKLRYSRSPTDTTRKYIFLNIMCTLALPKCLKLDRLLTTGKEYTYLIQSDYSTYLSEHFREVVDVGGPQRLCLEPLGLQQVLGHIGGVDEHAMQGALLISI